MVILLHNYLDSILFVSSFIYFVTFVNSFHLVFSLNSWGIFCFRCRHYWFLLYFVLTFFFTYRGFCWLLLLCECCHLSVQLSACPTVLTILLIMTSSFCAFLNQPPPSIPQICIVGQLFTCDQSDWFRYFLNCCFWEVCCHYDAYHDDDDAADVDDELA